MSSSDGDPYSSGDEDSALQRKRARASDDESSSSSSSSSAESSVDDSAAKESLLGLLLVILKIAQPSETVNSALRRLQAKSTAAFNELTDAALKIQVQHGLCVLGMFREALLKKAMMLAARSGEEVPAMYVLQWKHDPEKTVHGPFDSKTMQQWQEKQFFHRKPALVSNANHVERVWVEASTAAFA